MAILDRFQCPWKACWALGPCAVWPVAVVVPFPSINKHARSGGAVAQIRDHPHQIGPLSRHLLRHFTRTNILLHSRCTGGRCLSDPRPYSPSLVVHACFVRMVPLPYSKFMGQTEPERARLAWTNNVRTIVDWHFLRAPQCPQRDAMDCHGCVVPNLRSERKQEVHFHSFSTRQVSPDPKSTIGRSRDASAEDNTSAKGSQECQIVCHLTKFPSHGPGAG